MNDGSCKRRLSPPKHLVAACLLPACILLLLMAGIASSQSGRRLPSRGSKPEPAPSTQPEPSKKEPEKEKLTILVAKDVSAFGLRGGVYGSLVVDGCVERLRQAIAINAVPGNEMNRKEASDWAKEHDNGNVVWLEIKSDRIDFDPAESRRDDLKHVYVNYTLFAAKTGKPTSGRVFLSQAGGLSDVVVGLPSPRIGSTDYLYQRCGRAVADRVLELLKIPLPPGRQNNRSGL